MWTTLFVLSLALQMGPEPQPQPLGPPRVPIGYAPAPEGTPLRVVGRPWIDGPGFRATVRNDGTRTIVRLSYVALMVRWPWPFTQPVQPFEHDFGTMELRPGHTIALSSPWLNSAELDRLVAAAPDKIQMFLAPSRIRFDDGTEWIQALDLTATDSETAMKRPPPVLPRAMLGAAASSPAASDGLCRDDFNRGYSPGATIAIRGEPDKIAQCVKGRWTEVTR